MNIRVFASSLNPGRIATAAPFRTARCMPGNLDKRRGAFLVSNSQADPKVSLGRYSNASDHRGKE
jgi:hypothetical protein